LKSPEAKLGIITVISNKGGVGKTSFAISAGYYLSKKSGSATLLMELDSSPGDFGPIFDIDSKRSLEMAVRFPANFSNYIKKIDNNLFALKGFPSPFLAESAASEGIKNLINTITSRYANIIIDTQTVFNRPLLDVCNMASKIFLVTDNCLESLARVINLYEILTLTYAIDKRRVNLIVNKKRLTDYFRIWDFSKLTEVPVQGFISYDRNFSKTLFISNKNKLVKTKMYRQVGRIIENGFKT
jgi:MinD-like ATPase involved in chromosome partitioning or flagellar assembly